jgi:hypothetical protein
MPASLCCLHVTANGARVDEWEHDPEVECDRSSARSGIARFILRLPDEWPLQLRLLLLRKEADGLITAFFEDVSLFYPIDFDDALQWPWPPPLPSYSAVGQEEDACGILHLVDTTFTYGCAVANYSGCAISTGLNGRADVKRGACGSHVGMDDVMRFLQKQDCKYVLVNDRCSQLQSRKSSLDAQQQLRVWSGMHENNSQQPCQAYISSAETNFSQVVTLFTDYMVARAEDVRRLHPAEIFGVWLVEPRSICPSCYQHVADHAAAFDIILSHDIEFLSDVRRRHPKGTAAAAFVPFASSLLHPPFIGLHKEIKSQLVSCFVSNKRMLIGHVLRHAVYNDARLRGSVHFYGQAAGNEIEHKADAMAPYMFHVVIENSRARSYYSEKLIDCFLTGIIPLYWGGALPSAFDHSGIITWNTLEDLVQAVSSLSADAYWSRHSSVVHNFNLALSTSYTHTMQLSWNAYLLPLAQIRAKELEHNLAEAHRLFDIACKRRSEENRDFLSDAAHAVQAAFAGSRALNRLSSVHFWIVVYVDSTMTIPRLERCLKQLQAQTLSSWSAVLVVDSSVDELPDHRALLASHVSDHRIKIWLSERCKTKLECILLALDDSSSSFDESIDPVCFFLQGRDSLLSSDSLDRIAEHYLHLNCWVTYGSSVLSPSMILEASRDAAVEDHFFPASVYERNTARATEWLRGRPPFFTLLRSVMRRIPASHSRLRGDEGDPSLAILISAVELAGDRVVPLIHVVHERWTSRSVWDAAAGGSELFHVQAAWVQRERVMQLPPLRRLPDARMSPASSIRPTVRVVVKGGLLQPPGTTEASVSVSASGIWIPEEGTLRFAVDGEELAGIGEMYSFVFMMPTLYGNKWQLQAQLLSATNRHHVIAEETVTLELDDDL